ncbi:2-oxo-4-hydroxy-4-carboxy-5-ureidoimidazoline decarboxylase [Streptomyces sp. NPDC050617]|uniref:2-oxo-4-hydroxy-4-carboxy-5-ureidoimidazoline decarboxylase n=1 Tax=Streptomyces sp. NPDC050617 TaxID=3154628 RepID=UPI00341A6E9C
MHHGLDRLNSAAPRAAEEALRACCGSRRWIERIAAHRPYPDLDALLAAADEAAYDLTPADLAEALAGEQAAHHPPLAADSGDPAGPPGPGTLAAYTALRAAHAAYESKFGHVFVICLDSFAPEEALGQVLAAIRVRLTHEPDEERAVTADETRRLARGRLARLVTEAAPVPDAQGCPGA